MGYPILLLAHVGIGFLIHQFQPLSLLYFLGVFAYFTLRILVTGNGGNEALMAAAYLAGAEVLLRMTGGAVFYETGKYGVVFFLILGMYFKGSSLKSIPYWIYLFLLFPGVIIASQNLDYDVVFRRAIAFNLSGAICLGVCAIYCYHKKISRQHFDRILLMLLLPLVTNMAYLFFYTPPLEELEINSGANFAASGGFGPNQISTVMGMGSLLLISRLLILKDKILNVLDFILLGLMSFRALATFSRGGVLTALICTVVFSLVFYFRQNYSERNILNLRIFLLGGVLFLTWTFTFFQTSGLIRNRYTNTDSSGKSKGDITTGRMDLLNTELATFFLNPVVGVGVGSADRFREEEFGKHTNTHNEFSRLLSEHGLLGLFAILILVLIPFLFWMRFRSNSFFLAFMIFWLLTINHSAMRIALPALVYGLALLYISDEKKNTLCR